MNCELCGSNAFSEISVLCEYTGGQPIHVCEDCGFIQVINRRTPEEIWAQWDGKTAGDEVYKAAEAPVIARHAYAASFIVDNIHINPKNKHEFLDIGSADGKFGNFAFRNFGIPVTSYDGMAEDLNTKYANTSILWTLENCGSCMDVLKAARKITKDSIVIATGSRILVPFKKPLNYYLDESPLDLHPWRFSYRTLVAMLYRAGFTVKKHNQYISSDYLVVVAGPQKPFEVVGDDYKKVINFFERWHKETQYYA